MKFTRLLSALLGCCLASGVLAQTSATGAEKQNTQVHVTPHVLSAERDMQEQARAWGLQIEEWTRYQNLMNGPLGIYSPGLDPLTALGIEARNDEERRRYAERQVQAESMRVAKELAYQQAYDEAFRRLYPDLMPVVGLAGLDSSKSGSTGTAYVQQSGEDNGQSNGQSDGRLAVFVKENCPACDERVVALQKANQSFDIYVVGSNADDAVVRRWATRAGIDADKVRERIITLNHDDGRWLLTGVGGELPAVVREVNGGSGRLWQRE